jgi:small subunit ribosomal protein S3
MGHKIHPTGLRLGITQDHRSRWYAPARPIRPSCRRTIGSAKFVHKKYGAAGISDVLIARKADQLEVEPKRHAQVCSSAARAAASKNCAAAFRPPSVMPHRQVRINVVEVERVDADAYLLAGVHRPAAGEARCLPPRDAHGCAAAPNGPACSASRSWWPVV